MQLFTALARWFSRSTAYSGILGDLRVGQPRRAGRGVAVEIAASSPALGGVIDLQIELGGTLRAPLLLGHGRVAELGLGLARLRDVQVELSLGRTRGHADLRWGRSSVRIELSGGRPTRLRGSVVAMDVGLPPSALTLSKGTTLSLDLTFAEVGPSLHGSLRARELAIVRGARPFIPGQVLTDAHADVTLDTHGLMVRELTASLAGGTLRGEARVAWTASGPAEVSGSLSLACVGPAFVEKLAREAEPPMPMSLPRDAVLSGAVLLAADSRVTAELTLETARSRLEVFSVVDAAGNLARSAVNGKISFSDAMTVAGPEAPWRPLRPGAFEIAGVLHGPASSPAFEGRVSTARLALGHRNRHDVPSVVCEHVSLAVRATPSSVEWKRLQVAAYGGTIECTGRAELAIVGERFICTTFISHVEARALDAALLPLGQGGRMLGDLVGGRVFLEIDLRRSGAREQAVLGEGRGHIVAPEYRVSGEARETLLRLGLPLPSLLGAGPAEARFVLDEHTLHVERIAARVEGIDIEGALSVTRADQAIQGLLRIHLLRGYLEKSVLLLAPRLLAGGTVIIPVTVDGTARAPRVEADVRSALGNLLRGSRMSDVARSIRARTGRRRPI